MNTVSIPNILQQENVNIKPYTFDTSLGLFRVGTNKVEVTPSDICDFNLQDDQTKSLREVEELCLGFLNGHRIVTGPRFYDFVETKAGDQALIMAPSIILSVFNSLNNGVAQAREESIGDGPFRVHVDRLRHGHINLYTIGNCACFGAEDGLIRERQWGTGYAEYKFHNIDTMAQRSSLLAGIGYVAAQANP